MPPAEDANFVLTNKCLEICQKLASQGQKFSFSLSIGSNFSFSLDTKEKYTSLDCRQVRTPLHAGCKEEAEPLISEEEFEEEGRISEKKVWKFKDRSVRTKEVHTQV